MVSTLINSTDRSENNYIDRLDMASIKWVWMDLDDTLIDFKHNSRKALMRLYQTEGLAEWFPTEESWIEAYEKINKPLWEQYSRGDITVEKLRFDRFFIPLIDGRVSLPEAKKRALKYDKLYLDLLAMEKKTIDGAHGLLTDLRNNGYKVGVLSNGFAEVQHRKIKSAGLSTLIDLVVLSDDIGYTKPDVRLFRFAMERSGEYDCGSHLMVGDNISTDIRGALDSGWTAIHFNQGRKNISDIAVTIGSLDELRKILGLK